MKLFKQKKKKNRPTNCDDARELRAPRRKRQISNTKLLADESAPVQYIHKEPLTVIRRVALMTAELQNAAGQDDADDEEDDRGRDPERPPQPVAAGPLGLGPRDGGGGGGGVGFGPRSEVDHGALGGAHVLEQETSGVVAVGRVVRRPRVPVVGRVPPGGRGRRRHVDSCG